jgi:hypothetical protein
VQCEPILEFYLESQMTKRIFISLAALVLTVTAGNTAFAAEPAVDLTGAPVPVVNSTPSINSAQEAKPDSFTLKPESIQEISAEEAVRRALRAYDAAIKNDPFWIKPKSVYGPVESVGGSPNPSPRSLRFDRKDSSSSYVDMSDFSPYDSDRLSNDARRQISTSRQRTADRIADMISPGFGRSEFDVGDSHVRIDYIYARRCKMRGIGVCLQVTFR